MWENGYGATSVDAICDRAGAKKGSFYYFFKSKSELAAAALEAEWNKNRVHMDSVFSPTVPPIERFQRYFDFVHDSLAARQQQCGSIARLSDALDWQRNYHRTKWSAKRSIAFWIGR